MSGIAIEAETIPGRQATFVTCSRHGSSRIASRSFSDANTRPGTRMAPERGSSHSVSEIWTMLTASPSLARRTPRLGQGAHASLDPLVAVAIGFFERPEPSDPAGGGSGRESPG